MTAETDERKPLRVAIVGSGPSGFYAAGHLLSKAGRPIEVDVFERLPTPWGLVRGGVAPDHPKIKSVTRVYEKTAAKEGFRFFGNVEIGRDVTHEELASWYDVVLYASGTAGDKKSGIPGEDLAGSLSATEFVGWYNAHPDFRDLDPDLSPKRAVVIGNGNVAIDCARMLTLSHDELAVTDIADHALELLDDAGVEEILVLGRRGPEQAAFTNPELLELGELADADVIVDPADLEIAEELREDDLDATARKNVEILREYAERPPSGKRKRVVLKFLTSPVELLGNGRVEQIRLVRNELIRDDSGKLRARATDQEETIDAGLVLRAIGYTGSAIPGVPFDERSGLIPHDGDGRVLEEPGGTAVPGLYTAGWIKRGPSGVIGTNKKCAQETVDAILADFDGRESAIGIDTDDVAEVLGGRIPDLVDYAGWELIDAHEKGLGEPHGRPRVKLTLVDEMVRIAAENEPAAR
ncbi:MAG: FAD-dependent oxidoreductase [Solirubrobacteraceae bacterium]|nr:FAD-dependent oxidoreductase [Solirubrobacteraceae bacterium]